MPAESIDVSQHNHVSYSGSFYNSLAYVKIMEDFITVRVIRMHIVLPFLSFGGNLLDECGWYLWHTLTRVSLDHVLSPCIFVLVFA